MKNDETVSLQKELEFYSNLIANHEKTNQKAIFNSTRIKNSNAYSVQRKNDVVSFPERKNSYKLNTFLHPSSQPSCSFNASHSIKKQPALVFASHKPVSTVFKRTNSKFSLNCSSDRKLTKCSTENQLKKSSESLKNSSEYTWCRKSEASEVKNVGLCDSKLPPKSANIPVTTKSCPENLINEIISITEQLKMKSENLNILKNKQASSNTKVVSDKTKCLLPNVKKTSIIAKVSPKVKTKKYQKHFNENDFLPNVSKTTVIDKPSPKIEIKKDKICDSTKEKIKPSLNSSNLNMKDTQSKTTYCNMLENLKSIEKKLSEVKKPERLKIGKYRSKTSLHSKSFTSQQHKNSNIIKKKVSSKYCFINKHSSFKSQSPRKITSSSISKCSTNVPKGLLSSPPNVSNLASKNVHVTSTYKIIKNVPTSLNKSNSLHKILLIKKGRETKQCNSARKKHNFKLVNRNNVIKKNTQPAENSQRTPLNTVFVSMHNKSVKSPLNTGVDLDLLRELASEHIPRKRIYRSKNIIINSHSVQSKVAKMIKSKYFTRKFSSRKHHLITSKYFRDPFRNSQNRLHQSTRNMIRKNKYNSRNHFSNKYQHQCLNRQKKDIVNLGGERFMVDSSGKTLRKLPKSNPYYFRKATLRVTSPRLSALKSPNLKKNSSPVSKALASRALNRSIDTVLSASVKKKLRKVNSYCMFYNRFGRCNKGLKCSYVHDPSKIAVCTRFLRGTCKNEKCLFSHEIDPGKMAICSFFLRGSCTKGDCPYRHEHLSPDATLCKDFIQGYCKNGKECLKAHVLLCPKFLQGNCKKGKNCAFIHTLSEEKSVLNTEVIPKKSEDQSSDIIGRYFECNSEVPSIKEKKLVIPRTKCLPEQPSFISLKMNESL